VPQPIKFPVDIRCSVYTLFPSETIFTIILSVGLANKPPDGLIEAALYDGEDGTPTANSSFSLAIT